MSETIEAPIAQAPRPRSLVTRFADRFGVEPARMLNTLKATAFRSDKPISDEQMMALLIVAEQYKLNPFTKEIYAYPDKGGIVPVVSVDGWVRIVNEHPQFDGVEFDMASDFTACTCIIYRKDRSRPIKVTEYLVECKRNTQPWTQSPRRMLRHKSLIQCARIAFGFAGIYDEDEATRIVNRDMGAADVVEPPAGSAARVRAALAQRNAQPVDDATMPERGRDIDELNDEPPKTYAKLVDEMLHAGNADTAALVLDEARSALPPEQLVEMTDLYRSRWQPTEEPNQ